MKRTNEEKIMTLNFDNKKGVNIEKSKYDQIKNLILKHMTNKTSILTSELSNIVKDELEDTFEGKIGWYFMAIKLDLEVRGVIERLPKSSPQQIRLLNKK
ncbi:MAG: DUF6958 family protein [Patescibacteria group bacterium]